MKHFSPLAFVGEYKTAEQLGIPVWKRDRLIQFINDVEQGRITPDKFSMKVPCGTACCIGGHTRLLNPSEDIVGTLFNLFFPGGKGLNFSVDIDPYSQHWGWRSTPREGAHATKRYLHGLDPWAFESFETKV